MTTILVSPYAVYDDPDIYEREREKFFRGLHGNFWPWNVKFQIKNYLLSIVCAVHEPDLSLIFTRLGMIHKAHPD